MSMLIRKEREARLRPMRMEDMDEVRDVGQIAWSDLAMHDIGRKFKYPKRSEKIIDAYLDTDPGGCIVAEVDGKIIGSAFCHTWGKVGWTGPLEVLPTYQDHGIGRKLLGVCESHLAERGCTVVGLETMCHLPKNLHFYLSSGYRTGQTTLIMEKVIRREAMDTAGVREIARGALGTELEVVTDLSRSINPQLDYAPEVASIVRKDLGSVFLLDGKDGPLGCALLHTYQRGEEAPYSSVKAVLVHPQAKEPRSVFDRLMSKCELRSLEEGKTKLLTRFSPIDTRMYEVMTARSYALRGANLRMVKSGDYMETGWCNITSWAG
jgi:GNAT superfamily N-acetyltransferase